MTSPILQAEKCYIRESARRHSLERYLLKVKIIEIKKANHLARFSFEEYLVF